MGGEQSQDLDEEKNRRKEGGRDAHQAFQTHAPPDRSGFGLSKTSQLGGQPRLLGNWRTVLGNSGVINLDSMEIFLGEAKT